MGASSSPGRGADRAGAHRPDRQVRQLPDAYLSVVESLKHAGFHHGAKVEIDWIQAEDVEGLARRRPPGRPRRHRDPRRLRRRGIEGKIAAARYAREEGIPCLGLCLGLHAMTIEFARNVLGLMGANSTEIDPTTPHPVIDLMHDQRDVTDKGGTMRLGAYYAVLAAQGTKVAEAYGEPVVSERHRHRYEFNPNYRARFEEAGFVCSGTSPDQRLVEFIELADHPYWVGTQAHPEFKSRPDRPHPLFRELVGARCSGGRPASAPRSTRQTEPGDTAAPAVARRPSTPDRRSGDSPRPRSTTATSGGSSSPSSRRPTATASSATSSARPVPSPSCR